MSKDPIKDLMSDFDSTPGPESDSKNRRPITIWVPAATKEKYDRVQAASDRKLSKRVRKVVIEIIEHVDKSA